MSKDSLRSRLIGDTAPERKSILVTDKESGDTFEVREATVRERSNLVARLSDEKIPEKDKLRLMQVSAVILCTYDPVSGERVFGWGDEGALSEVGTGTVFDDLFTAGQKMLGLEDLTDKGKKPGADESSETPTD